MTIWEYLILCVFAIVAIVFVCFASLHFGSVFNNQEYYDERQQIAQGKAFRVAFFVGILYYFLICTSMKYMPSEVGSLDDLRAAILVGLLLQCAVYSTCCALQGALVPFKGMSLFSTAILWGATGVLNIILVARHAVRQGISEPLALSDGDSMILGVFFIYHSVLHLGQMLRKERE